MCFFGYSVGFPCHKKETDESYSKDGNSDEWREYDSF